MNTGSRDEQKALADFSAIAQGFRDYSRNRKADRLEKMTGTILAAMVSNPDYFNTPTPYLIEQAIKIAGETLYQLKIR